MLKKVIHWFRQDLRLSDNPGLITASQTGNVLPLFIIDTTHSKEFVIGEASRCWLHHSLQKLNNTLDQKLIVCSGDPIDIVLKLVKQYQIDEVHWNRCYEPWQIKRDKELKAKLKSLGLLVKSHNGSLLWEPQDIKNQNGKNYKVFTPFYRKGCLNHAPPRVPLAKPPKLQYFSPKELRKSVDSLKLLAHHSWGEKLMSKWEVGEATAIERLKKFITQGLSDYAEGRNFPAQLNISRLSPYLHWGEISPNQIWYEIKKLHGTKNTDTFLSELGWREFSYHLLYYYPELPIKNLQEKFKFDPDGMKNAIDSYTQTTLANTPNIFKDYTTNILAQKWQFLTFGLFGPP